MPVHRLIAAPLGWTALALLGSILLHLDRAPVWVTTVALGLIAWRMVAAIRPLWVPGKLIRPLIAFGLVAAVWSEFHTLNGLAAGTLLLLLMAAVKLLETQARRDQYIVVGGSLFLLLAACLERQSLLRTPLYVLEAWVCCAALAIIAYAPKETTGAGGVAMASSGLGSGSALTGSGLNSRAALLLAARTLLYAVPLAVVLFMFFPRLPGAFWALPRPEGAQTGLGDTMSPGSISQLTSSYEIAFRVKFDGLAPPPQQRYYRGPVLHKFDGYTWSRVPDDSYGAQPLAHLGDAYRYTVSLEPSQQRWWFSLDTVDHTPDSKVALTYDHELIASDPVTTPTSYTAVSHTFTQATQPLSKLAQQVETRLPHERNPRAVQLAREMRNRAGSDRAFVAAVLEMLRTGGFVYSLTPPLLDFNSVDDFIFNTRSGFCGHYASAFVTLMRGGGVPARVVTGYLGGEWNPIGGYFIVRQSDAHSWAEVWLEGRGWTRVDPTAVVEPDRLTRGVLDLLPGAGSTETRLVRASPALTRLLQRWDAINTWWNDAVLKFDHHSQLRFLSRLGVSTPTLRTLGWAFVTALLVWLGWIAWQVGRAPRPLRPDRLARAYARLCKKLARAGAPREAHQGPLDYAAVVGGRRPDLAPQARSLLAKYADLRYGVAHGAESYATQVRAFERAVAKLGISP